MHTELPPRRHPLWNVLKSHPLLFLPITGFIVSVISFLAVVVPVIFAGQGKALGTNLIAVWYVLGWMLLVTVSVRTIGVRQLITMFFAGFFLSTMVSFLLVRPVLDQFGANDVTAALWVAAVEELAKALPLALTLWAYVRRRGQAHGISDFVLMGTAIGGGMTVHEDLLYGRSLSRGSSLFAPFEGQWGATFPVMVTDWGPTMTGHVGWGTIIGLGLAFASVYRKHRVLSLCFALLPLCIAIIDHAAWNARGALAVPLTALSLQHTLAIAVFVAALPLALIYDVLRRRHLPPELPSPGFTMHRVALSQPRDPWRVLVNFLALGHYRRGWISSAYDRATPGGSGRASNDNHRLEAWFRVIFPAPKSPV